MYSCTYPNCPPIPPLLIPKMNYGIPYILEDKTGSIIASQFDDIHDRMRLYIRPIQRNELHAAYLIYDDSHPTQSVCLDFNAKNALGTITIGAGGGHVPMGQFLPRVSGYASFALPITQQLIPSPSSRNREFRASDGQTYTWSRTCKADREWTVRIISVYFGSRVDIRPVRKLEQISRRFICF